MGTQFHGELTPELIGRWANLPQYIEWLEAAMGPGAYSRISAQSKSQLPRTERVSRTMFENLTASRKRPSAAA
jgi:hypothetical protein